MKKKIWLIAAAFLVLVGAILFSVAMSGYHWDFAALSTGKYETHIYEVKEGFSNLSINTDTADILFVLADDGKCKVECYEEEKERHSVAVGEDTLVIDRVDDKAWYDHIGINFGSPKITIYLPKTEYTSLFISESTGDIEIPKDFRFADVDISLSTGDVSFFASASNRIKMEADTGTICAENISAGELDLSTTTGRITVANAACQGDAAIEVSTGKASLTDVVCKNLVSDGSTGDILLKNVVAAEKISIERGTGDVRFDSSDAAGIFVETDTGAVGGTLLSEKVFIIQTNTGSIDVPKTTKGGMCEIHTDTGDIKLAIK